MMLGDQGLSRRSLLALGLGAAVAATATGADAQAGGSASTLRGEHDGQRGRRLAGKTALVTGSTDGLGREVARRLGALGAMVIVHGRNAERGAAAVREVQDAGGYAEFRRADFASLAEVRNLAAEIRAAHGRLDLLINNAGIWTDGTDVRRESADGHELVFAVNYLAGFLLTHRLLPLIRESAPARIVNVSSLAQQPIDFDDVMLMRGFSPGRAYAQSKLAQVMFTLDLAAELDASRITVNSLHPATLMDTTMVQQAGATPRSTKDEGADAVMHLAVSTELEGRSGLFFNGLREARAHAQAYDTVARARLRTLSRKLTGVG